jgi:hypothetical protein
MVKSTDRSRWGDIGQATALGLALAPFAFLFSAWIPSLAVIFAIGAIVGGSFDLPGSIGRRRRFALLAIALGILASVVTVIVVSLTTTGSVSGTAGTAVPPPR